MKRLIGIVALLAGTGCFHIHYVTGEPQAPNASYEAWHHGGIFGLVEFVQPLDVSNICPQGTARVDSEESFLNGLVRAVTWSLYTPETVTVTCVPGPHGETPQAPTRPWK